MFNIRVGFSGESELRWALIQLVISEYVVSTGRAYKAPSAVTIADVVRIGSSEPRIVARIATSTKTMDELAQQVAYTLHRATSWQQAQQQLQDEIDLEKDIR